MPIQELNAQEFAKNLAQQAGTYIPEDISDDHRKYITKKVYEFCFITGDHLLKQYQEQFTDEDAVIVIQFIGEWTFHKAIDLIRSELRHEYWDTILQQVAFAALKAALQAHGENLDQANAAAMIETQVMEAYKHCIEHLLKSNVLKQEEVDKILSYSNVDQMAEESVQTNVESVDNDEKTLKYVATALILKKLPKEKTNKILKSLGESEKQKILSCMQIENLEQKVAPEVINQYIQDLKKTLSLSTRPNKLEMVKSFKILQEKYGEEKIIDITMYERSKIQEFLSACLFEEGVNVTKVELSPYIVKILYSYLRSKLAA